jgi:hypothetical protein
MKNIRLYILLLAVFFCVIQNKTIAQTNVSGGIYSNTTWTLANSPYIVVDTVVVFPGVTLTIQPGVVVKFENDKLLEIRQAQLIAVGTFNDSITFTSNSLTPMSGSWAGVSIIGGTLQSDFNYSNFRYSSGGLSNSSDTLKVKNSCFVNNNWGLNGFHLYVDSCSFTNNTAIGLGVSWGGSVSNSYFANNNSAINGFSSGYTSFLGHTYINNCVFKHNQVGIVNVSYGVIENCNLTNNQFGLMDNNHFLDLANGASRIKNCVVDSNIVMGLCLGYGDSILNCQIKYNGVGLSDSVVSATGSGGNFISGNEIENNGIGIKLWATNYVTCNKICNNTYYDLHYNYSTNITALNNYWCNTDSASIATKIYDGYDNINVGLLSFVPFDTSQCYLAVGAMEKEFTKISWAVFPNPVVSEFTIAFSETQSGTIKVIDLLGKLLYCRKFNGFKTSINVADLPQGLYVVEVTTPVGIAKQKFIKH